MKCKHLLFLIYLSISSLRSIAQTAVPDEINKLYSYLLTSSNYKKIIAEIQANKSLYRDTSVTSKGTTEMFPLNDISSFSTISSEIRLVVLLVNKIPRYRSEVVSDSLLTVSLSIFLKDSLTTKEANFILKAFRKTIRTYYPNEWVGRHPDTKIRTIFYDNSKFGISNPPFRLMMDRSKTGRYRILLTYTTILEKY